MESSFDLNCSNNLINNRRPTQQLLFSTPGIDPRKYVNDDPHEYINIFYAFSTVSFLPSRECLFDAPASTLLNRKPDEGPPINAGSNAIVRIPKGLDRCRLRVCLFTWQHHLHGRIIPPSTIHAGRYEPLSLQTSCAALSLFLLWGRRPISSVDQEIPLFSRGKSSSHDEYSLVDNRW